MVKKIKEIDYYAIIGVMPHTITDDVIELRRMSLVDGNAFKQFSDLFDQALAKHRQEVLKEVFEMIENYKGEEEESFADAYINLVEHILKVKNLLR